MFARLKKSGKYQYLQIVENRRDGKKTVQRVIATIGRMDQLQTGNDIEALVRSLSRFSEKVLLVLSGKNDVHASAKKIGPSLIFDRLWKELAIGRIIQAHLAERKFGFDVERAVFLTVLHRLFVSGSDRYCEKWHRDYVINGVEDLSLHHLYRAMAFLGEDLEDQEGKTPFAPRCIKDIIEEDMFQVRRNLFTGLDVVFFDTTSIYFEGEGGETIGQFGHNKDHRPDLHQMVVGVILDNEGNPICCEMWPGNTADVKSLIPVIERIKNRFQIKQFCIVADRGMISKEILAHLEMENIYYILGARLRAVKEIKEEVLSRAGRYREVYPEGISSKDPSPLKVKEVNIAENRYIVCLNEKQARKDAADRQAIIDGLQEKIKSNPKSLVGNKGYRKYLSLDRDTVSINQQKIRDEERFDGKWVLQTNTNMTPQQIAIKYKELWQVEHVFRDMKSILVTRPVFHKTDETIRGHVFCSFLALALRKELDHRLEKAGHSFEWADIKQDIKALQEITIEDNGKTMAVRSECIGTCGKVFQAVGIAMPPTIREMP
ncbi:MAG: IS1634 family transposase [Candidatus Pacebacteria bacterium]|nr:IS1634 family transposase [Candidatus Paceibacterota bacterium]